MSNESMANYITDTPSEIQELNALNDLLRQQLTATQEQLKDAREVVGFYAKGSATRVDRYDYSNVFVDGMGPFNITGHRARAFLAKYPREIPQEVSK